MEELKIEAGCGNVFEDLGLPDAHEYCVKSDLAGQINSILAHRHLAQKDSAELLGVSQAKISGMKNGNLHGISLEKLLDMMTLLGRNVEISIKKNTRAEPSRVYVNAGNLVA